jgi:putative flippase GtrA
MSVVEYLLVEETTNWKIQFFRYVFVGGFSFFVDYGLLFILTEFFHLFYLISATISFVVGLVINYLLSTKWIFKKSKLSSSTLEFIIYGIIGVVGLILNNILLFIFTDLLMIHYMISKLITTVIVMGWNFFGRRIILFNN